MINLAVGLIKLVKIIRLVEVVIESSEAITPVAALIILVGRKVGIKHSSTLFSFHSLSNFQLCNHHLLH